jgi:hypothetical protein
VFRSIEHLKGFCPSKAVRKMRSLRLFVIVLAVVMLGIPVVSFGYDINDPDLPIGDAEYQIYGMDMDQAGSILTLKIYTNSPENGHRILTQGYVPSYWDTFPGDLAIDLYNDNSYEYGVAFTSHDGFQLGNLYRVTEWEISNNYNPAKPVPPPIPFNFRSGEIVTIKTADQNLGPVDSVPTWTQIPPLGSGGLPSYIVSVTLDVTDFLPPGFADVVAFRWPSGTCANDIVEGSSTLSAVPEPATILLVSSGLACVAALGRRKRSDR